MSMQNLKLGYRIGAMVLVSMLFCMVPFLGSAATGSEPKILWIDSYRSGYEWSDGIERGIRNTLKHAKVRLKTIHMDTKACKSTECMQAAARRAKAEIEIFEPDVLIASDDNAQRYLVVPHYRDTDLPVVFCGVNWDASVYGYPTRNITGMIEVDLVNETVKLMRRHAKGDRIGYISGDTASDRKIITALNQRFFNLKMQAYRVNTYFDFQKRFLQLQSDVDMIFIRNYAGIDGWEALKAKKFITANLRIPTGSNNDFMAPYVIFTLGKIPEEQGRYAAQTALKIIKGAKPADLPVVANHQARLTVNLDMARAADIVLPISVLQVATVIGQSAYDTTQQTIDALGGDFKGKRILWIDSYHKGYEWSDGIERAIREVFFDKGIELNVIRMNTKRENTDHLIKASAVRAKDRLEALKPDIVIASDDNAQKYLIAPHYKNTGLPVVFCGVNWDVGVYGYPVRNITGMVEIDGVEELIGLLRQNAGGDRVGYLSGNTVTERKLVKIYNQRFFNGRMKSYMVKTQKEFEKQFSAAQHEVDVLFLSNYTGIADWDAEKTLRYVISNTRIPTGSFNSFMQDFVVCTMAKSPEEQGRYAAMTALKILGGRSPSSIPLVTNKQRRLTINLKLAQSAGIVFPVAVLKQARVIGQYSSD